MRKPGQFSLATLQVAYKLAAERRPQGGSPISVWDVGCGTGFVGLLMAKSGGDKIGPVFCSDVSEDAVACTRSNAKRLGLNARVTASSIDLFDDSEATAQYDVIVFNPPFMPDGVPGHEPCDGGGPNGGDIAIRFCEGVRERLTEGGWACLAIADYVDSGEILKTLVTHFGSNVRLEERIILYPYQTPKWSSLAYEILHRDDLERICKYRFATCLLGNREFIAFKMRHYCAQKAVK